MSWVAQDRDRVSINIDAQKASDYENAKKDGLPVITKEVDSGVKPFEPVKFQPVRSPGIYEAEFGVKSGDIIFHFWPDGYHKAERDGRAKPAFKPHFKHHLTETMSAVFGSGRVEFREDADMGAIFIKAFGWGENDNHRKICIDACERFHRSMGGSEG